MPISYSIQDVVTPNATFTLNGAAYDPTTVTLKVRPPANAAVITIVAPNALILHDDTGLYEYDLTLSALGFWYVDWLGVGSFTDSHGHVRPYREHQQAQYRVYNRLFTRI